MKNDDKKYMNSLRSHYQLINKIVHKKVKNNEDLTDLELLYFIYFTEIAPVVVKIQKEKED